MPKISVLPAGSALAGSEVLPAVQGGATVKTTVDDITTYVMAYDAELAAIAGLTSAADRGIYFTGSGTASLFTFTAFARTIMDDADAAAVKTTLGLVIGTNVQAYDAQLADIAGITFAQGDVIYFNGSNLVNLGPGTSGYFLKTQGAGANPTWAAVTGATVGDADYGDIVVSAGVWTIDSLAVSTGKIAAAAVTLAKIANAAASSRILGSGSGGSGASYTELTAGTGIVIGASSVSADTGTSGAKIPLLNGANTHSGLATFSAGADMTPASTPSTTAVGYLGAPQNTQNGTYTTVMADAGKHIYHTSGSAHTWTIDSNANVAYPIGTVIAFVNESGGGNVTLAITSDTLRWGSSTGSRTLAANGTATALKVASTTWRLTGDGIT